MHFTRCVYLSDVGFTGELPRCRAILNPAPCSSSLSFSSPWHTLTFRKATEWKRSVILFYIKMWDLNKHLKTKPGTTEQNNKCRGVCACVRERKHGEYTSFNKDMKVKISFNSGAAGGWINCMEVNSEEEFWSDDGIDFRPSWGEILEAAKKEWKQPKLVLVIRWPRDKQSLSGTAAVSQWMWLLLP